MAVMGMGYIVVRLNSGFYMSLGRSKSKCSSQAAVVLLLGTFLCVLNNKTITSQVAYLVIQQLKVLQM